MMKFTIVRLIAAVAVFITALLLVEHRREKSDERQSQPEEKTILPETEAMEAWRWYNDQRAYPNGSIPADWRAKAAAHVQKNNLRSTNSIAAASWVSVGPDSIGGRVRSIAVSPRNPNVVYVGSVSGGVWKSTNGGGSWIPLTDFAPNLVIGCIAIDPKHPDTLYAGTGEGYFNVDALRGIGILKSTNGGTTWTVLSNFIGAHSPYYYYFINKIVIHPDSTNILYAALSASPTDEGVWKSTDAGASWTELSSLNTKSSMCVDLVMDPTKPAVLYGSFGLFTSDGVYKTTNAGTTWSKLTSGFPDTSTHYTRVSLTIEKSNPSILYACVADQHYYTQAILKTTNGGSRWTEVKKPFDTSIGVDSTHLGGQGWYNNVIAVDPINPSTVYTGGINLFKSTNAGKDWFRISDGYGVPYVHVDQHAITFESPSSPSILYFGNDGGVYKSTNGGQSFIDLNKGFITTQFYSGAVHPTAEIYYGGTQDNGTLQSTAPPVWKMVFGGDGGVTVVDYRTPTTVYGEYVYLDLQKSTDGGSHWTKMMYGIPNGPNATDGATDRCSFIAPYAMDPTNPQVLFAGTYRLFRTTNGGTSWTAVSSDLTGDGPGNVRTAGATITAIAIAAQSNATVYIGTSGSSGSLAKVLVSVNADATSPTWTEVTKSPLPNRFVTAIAVDPVNRDRAFVCFSGYGSGHVYMTATRGTTWFDVSGNLPDIPVNAIVIDSMDTRHLFIGTDLGVFESSVGGTTWVQQNAGLANVSIADLDIRRDGFLFAATHGRGFFKSTLPVSNSRGLAIVIHQNAVLTRYVDLYVTVQDSLLVPPAMQVSVSGGPSQPVALVQNSFRVYKGHYELPDSGAVTLSVTAQDSGHRTVVASRTFQSRLAKPGIPISIHSPNGEAELTVASDALTDSSYFVIIPDEAADQSASIVGQTYTIGPARRFAKALTLTFSYTDDLVRDRDVQLFSIVQQTDTGWIPIASQVNGLEKKVSARVTTLGRFALVYAVRTNPTGGEENHPASFSLFQNYPNPFNPTTNFGFRISDFGFVSLKVFDVLGREVTTLVDEVKSPGVYSVRWDGSRFPSGVYFYRLQSGDRSITRKMVLAR